MKNRWIAAMLAASITTTTFLPGAVAATKSKAERDTQRAAVGLTAASAYLLTKKSTRDIGAITAVGAGYAWKRHHDHVKGRHKREQAYRYRTRRAVSASSRSRSYRKNIKNPKAKRYGYKYRSSHAR